MSAKSIITMVEELEKKSNEYKDSLIDAGVTLLQLQKLAYLTASDVTSKNRQEQMRYDLVHACLNLQTPDYISRVMILTRMEEQG